MIQLLILLIASALCDIQITTEFPKGPNAGIGLATPMIIHLYPELCVLCPAELKIIPPYFHVTQTKQAMLKFQREQIMYVGDNVLGSNVGVNGSRMTSDFINDNNGELLFNIGQITIPEGSTDNEIQINVEVMVLNIDIIQFGSKLTLNINCQIGDQYTVHKTTLQVVQPSSIAVQTFQPVSPNEVYESQDEPQIMFSVTLPASSFTPVYNVSVTCSVINATPNFRTATTNPNSVSIRVTESGEEEMIKFVAEELRPGRVIVGNFGVYLQGTLQPDELNAMMSVTSYSAPLENGGRQLNTVTESIFVPIRLKSPTVSASDYPKSILIGNVLDFVLSVSVPALTCEYSVFLSSEYDSGNTALEFTSVITDNPPLSSSHKISAAGGTISVFGESQYNSSRNIDYKVSALVKNFNFLTVPSSLGVKIELEYNTNSNVQKLAQSSFTVHLLHPSLSVMSEAEQGLERVTLGMEVPFSVMVFHNLESGSDGHNIEVLVELTVPGVMSCNDEGVEVTQLLGSKLQVTIPYLSVGDTKSFSVIGSATSESRSNMQLVTTVTYAGCYNTNCQIYGPATFESAGLKLHSTSIASEFLPGEIGIQNNITLTILSVSQSSVCEYNASIGIPYISSQRLLGPLYATQISGNQSSELNSVSWFERDAQTNVRIVIREFENVKEIALILETELETPGVVTVTLQSFFRFCNSPLLVEEVSYPKFEVVDVTAVLHVSIVTQEIESQTKFTMQLNIQTEIVPMYNLTITIHNAWVVFESVDHYKLTQLSNGAVVVSDYVEAESQTTVMVRGVTRDITMSTETVSSWSYSYNSAPSGGKRYSGVTELPRVKISTPKISSHLVTNFANLISVGEKFDLVIDVLTVELTMDFVVKIFLPKCNGNRLLDVVSIHPPTIGRSLVLSIDQSTAITNDNLTIWFQTSSIPDSVKDEEDVLSIRISFLELFDVLDCQNKTFGIYHIVKYGLTPDFDIYQNTLYLTQAIPSLDIVFSHINPNKYLDGKDEVIFNLLIRHDAASLSKAYDISAEFVCEDFNILEFTVLTPIPAGLDTGDVSMSFSALPIGETFAVSVRTEVKADVVVGRSVVCGGKLQYMSSDNEASFNYIYSETFISDGIPLGNPQLVLWSLGKVGSEYIFRAILTLPEGTMPTVIVTVYAGLGVSITRCDVSASSAGVTTSANETQITARYAQSDLGKVVNRHDNIHTLWDSIAFEISARKTLPFGNLENIYVSLDTVKVYATEWTNECDLMANLQEVSEVIKVDGGDLLTYSAIISHSRMSELNCAQGTIVLKLENSNLLMESQIEIRTAKGLRMMCDITTNSDSSAQIRFSKLDLSDSIAVPLTVQVSPTLIPGNTVSLSAYVTYYSEKLGNLRRRTNTTYSRIILSKLPTVQASLIALHGSNDKVAIGETIEIKCQILIPEGVTDLSVGVDVKGVEADNIVITGITISNNSDHLYWNNIQKVQGLNQAFTMITKLRNTPDNLENSDDTVTVTIPAMINNSPDNVNGKVLEIMVMIGSSYTTDKMIENTLYFSLHIVEPALNMVAVASTEPSLTLLLSYDHSIAPSLIQSTANAYNVTSTVTPALSCALLTSSSTPRVSDNTVNLSVIELGSSADVNITCTTSPDIEIGNTQQISVHTSYMSFSGGGRVMTTESHTNRYFTSQLPTFELQFDGIVGRDMLQLGEKVDVLYYITLPLGTLPVSVIRWKFSAKLEMTLKSCQFEGQDLITTYYRTAHGVDAYISAVRNTLPDSRISCVSSVTTSMEIKDSQEVTLSVTTNYGLNKATTAISIQLLIPLLRTVFEMSASGGVQGGDMISAKYIIKHSKDSTGNAYNFWLNTTATGCRTDGSSSISKLFSDIPLGNTRSLLFSLIVLPNQLPGSPVYATSTFSYTSFPDLPLSFNLPSHTSSKLFIQSPTFTAEVCDNKLTIAVGDFGNICVRVIMPICKTDIEIKVQHPMIGDREVGEILDTITIQSTTGTTSTSGKHVRPLVTKSSVMVNGVNNSGASADNVTIRFPFLVLADENVVDGDHIKFTLNCHYAMFEGENGVMTEVSMSVVEPKISAVISIVNDSSTAYEKGSVIVLQYSVTHALSSVSPAYNVRLSMNSTGFTMASTELGAVLEVNKVVSGTTRVVLSDLLTFNALIPLTLNLLYSSTNTDVGRLYKDKVDVADVRIKRLDVDIDVDDASPVVGNIITAWVSLDIPNARGNLTVEVACSEAVYCEFTQLSSAPEGVVVGPQVRKFVEVTGQQEIQIIAKVLMKDRPVEELSILVKVDGEVARAVPIAVTDVTVTLDIPRDVKLVDGGDSVTSLFTLVPSHTLYSLSTTVDCNGTQSALLTCLDNDCQISSTVSTLIPPAIDLVCSFTTNYTSSPSNGKAYSSSTSFTIASTAPVTVTAGGGIGPVAVGTTFTHPLVLSLSEVQFSVRISVLCDPQGSTYQEQVVLQDFGIDADIATLTVTLDRVVNNESCGEMVLNVTPLSTSQFKMTNLTVLSKFLVLTTATEDISIHYYLHMGGVKSDVVSTIPLCTPSITQTVKVSVDGDSNMIYVRENSSLIYNITLTNTGLCSVYHPVTSFTSTYLSLTRVFNGEVLPGSSRVELVRWNASLAEVLASLQGAVTVNTTTSRIQSLSDLVALSTDLPTLYVLTPSVTFTPSTVLLYPGEESSVTLSVQLRYLLSDSLTLTIEYTGTQLNFESISYIGSSLIIGNTSKLQTPVTTPSSLTQSVTVNKAEIEEEKGRDATLDLTYSITPNSDGVQGVYVDVTVNDITVTKGLGVTLATPSLDVTVKSGDMGGFIPGDVVTLTLTLSHSALSATAAFDLLVGVSIPLICSNAKVVSVSNDDLAVTKVNSTYFTLRLAELALNTELVVRLQSEIQSTADGQGFLYNTSLYYSAVASSSEWSYTANIATPLKTGQPDMSLVLEEGALVTPGTVLAISCKIILRKSSSDLKLTINTTDALQLLSLRVTNIGSSISFSEEAGSKLVEIGTTLPDTVTKLDTGAYRFSFGEVECVNESINSTDNSLLLILSAKVLEGGSSAASIQSEIEFGRGRDVTSLPLTVIVPSVELELECTVDGLQCTDYMQVYNTSVILYTVKLSHRSNSTSTAYNLNVQLYIPYFDLQSVDTNVSVGELLQSNLGLKLSVAEFTLGTVVEWSTRLRVISLEEPVTSTAVAGYYCNSPTTEKKNFPLLFNSFSPTEKVALEYSGMYEREILGNSLHDTLYVCNTSCYSTQDGASWTALNPAIHSLLGIRVAPNSILYGVSSNGAYVMSRDIHTWSSIPYSFWSEVEGSSVLPQTQPWNSEPIITRLSMVFKGRPDGVYLETELGWVNVFTW